MQQQKKKDEHLFFLTIILISAMLFLLWYFGEDTIPILIAISCFFLGWLIFRCRCNKNRKNAVSVVQQIKKPFYGALTETENEKQQ